MKTYLINGNSLRTVYALDSESGKAVITQHRVVHGIGVILRVGITKEIVAIFADDGKLYFQAGNKTWDISKHGLEFVNVKVPMLFGIVRKFSALDSSGNVMFSSLYVDRFFSSWKNWIDITYDEFDRELDDIYLWLSSEVNNPNWKAELLKRWTAGVKVPDS